MLEFNPYDPATAENPYPLYRRLRDQAPVYHNPAMKFWTLSPSGASFTWAEYFSVASL